MIFFLFLFLPIRGQKCENGKGKHEEPVTFCQGLERFPDVGEIRKTINLGKLLKG